MSQKNKKIEKKLAKYSALAAGVIIAGNANAQIIYTDINPDITIPQLNSFALDVNNDGITDFNFQANTFSYGSSYTSYGYGYVYRIKADYVFVAPANNNEVLWSYISTNYGSSSLMPKALDKNDSVRVIPTSAQSWSTYYGLLNAQVSYYYKAWGYTYSYMYGVGDFQGVSDKYLGLKFKINSSTHYGWVRLDVAKDGKSFVVKDYAYESSPNKGILAGDMGVPVVEADVVSNIVLEDISDNSDASDLKVSFNKATDETTIKEYRIIVVKSSVAANFNVGSAEALDVARYTTVLKTGSDININLLSGAKDSDGDIIGINMVYRIFIMSVADGVNANTSSLYTSSSAIITLHTPTEAVQNLLVSDDGDAGNASDLKVSFDKISDETKLNEYRVIVVKTANSGGFDLSAAGQLPASNYEVVNKTGSNIQTMLSASLKDSDGDLVSNNISYNIFVLSVADGQNADLDQLSAPSSAIILSNTNLIEEEHVLLDRIYVSDKVLHVLLKEVSSVQFSLFDMNGKLLDSRKLHTKECEIDLNSYAQGSYIARLENSESEIFIEQILVK